VRERVDLVDKSHPEISMRQQCKLLDVARSTVTYKPVEVDPEDIRIKRLLDEVYMIDPCLGNRRLVTVLARDYDIRTDRKRVARLRREMGQETIWCKPRTSIPDDGHRKYPYLLRNLAIDRPDQVWCADITDARYYQELARLRRLSQTKAAPQIGRNEPCPCDSGRKYKQCCLNKTQS